MRATGIAFQAIRATTAIPAIVPPDNCNRDEEESLVGSVVVVVVVVAVGDVVGILHESQRTGQEFRIFSPLRGSSHSFGSYLSAQMIGSG